MNSFRHAIEEGTVDVWHGTAGVKWAAVLGPYRVNQNMNVNPYQPPASETPLVAELVVNDAEWTIEFEIGLDDLVAWNSYCHKHLPVFRRNFLRGWILLGAVMATIQGVLLLFEPTAIAAHAMTMVGMVAILAIYPWFYRFRLTNLARGMYREGASPNLVGRRRLTLSKDYLIFSTPLAQTITRWAGIERVIREKDVIYFLLSNISAIPVPLRAFANEEQFQKFAQAGREYHSSTTTPAPAAARG
jgi:hypothetical protein